MSPRPKIAMPRVPMRDDTCSTRCGRSKRLLIVLAACAFACICTIPAWWTVQGEASYDDAQYYSLVFEHQEAESAYVNGRKVRHGTYKAWWGVSETWLCFTLRRRGPLLVEANYVNGRLTGSYTAWHINGNLLATGGYVNGAKHGEWVHYRLDGTIFTRLIYDRGNVLAEETFEAE